MVFTLEDQSLIGLFILRLGAQHMLSLQAVETELFTGHHMTARHERRICAGDSIQLDKPFAAVAVVGGLSFQHKLTLFAGSKGDMQVMARDVAGIILHQIVEVKV